MEQNNRNTLAMAFKIHTYAVDLNVSSLVAQVEIDSPGHLLICTLCNYHFLTFNLERRTVFDVVAVGDPGVGVGR